MDQQVAERRRDARFPAPSDRDVQATVRPGCSVDLVDVSAGGALVQAPRPLRPGARVQLLVVSGNRRYAIQAQVLRCLVWALDPLAGVLYRGALRFDERVDWRATRASVAESVSR